MNTDSRDLIIGWLASVPVGMLFGLSLPGSLLFGWLIALGLVGAVAVVVMALSWVWIAVRGGHRAYASWRRSR